MSDSDYNITLFEACELLNKSKKTLSRYIRRGRITPQKVKSLQGTLEYRFSKADLDALKAELIKENRPDEPDEIDQTEETEQTGQPEQTRQDTPEAKAPLKAELTPPRPEQVGQDKTIISLLHETTELLKGQLTIKDGQISTLNEQVHKLIERDRETNILLKGLQDNILMLKPPAPETTETIEQTIPERPEAEQPKRGRPRLTLIVLLVILAFVLGIAFVLRIWPLIWPLII